MSLRDYQEKAVAEIRKEFTSGNRKVLLRLATGSGKTVIFSHMIKTAAERGLHAAVIVRGRKLVDQASRRLARESVPHGVMMANHWRNRPHEKIQVISIDTAISRNLRPKVDLLIIDECHLATSEGYKRFLSDYPEAFVVAVTATPYVEKGLRHVANKIVHPITMLDLIAQGYLVPFRYFAPSEPDLRNVKVSSSTKDYVNAELGEVMGTSVLTGKVIDHWIKIAQGLPTICFCVNIKHSKMMVEKFLSAGIAAEHCDADSTDNERDQTIRRLESGETKVVCNVGIFCTGIDIVSLGAIIMARPTKSKNLFIQQAGRGTRIFEGKENCILLDHSGNLHRHGFPTDEPEVDLDGKEKHTNKKEAKLCKECFAYYRGVQCPECGAEPKAVERVEIEETDDELKEIAQETDLILRELKKLQLEAKNKGRKQAWAFYRLVELYGSNAMPYIPSWFKNIYTRSVMQNKEKDLFEAVSSPDPFSNSPFTGASISRSSI